MDRAGRTFLLPAPPGSPLAGWHHVLRGAAGNHVTRSWFAGRPGSRISVLFLSLLLAGFMHAGAFAFSGVPFFPDLEFGAHSLPTSVAINDLNADGKPDLAVADFGSNSVSVLLGHGDGSFAPKTDYTTGSNPICVAVSALNPGHVRLR